MEASGREDLLPETSAGATAQASPGSQTESPKQRQQEPDAGTGSSPSSSGASSASENEEPLLKYQRLGGALKPLLSDAVSSGGLGDSASCLFVHPHFLVLGTYHGVVLQLTHEGEQMRRFHSHRAQVTAVSADVSGDSLASCSNDGRVVVYDVSSKAKAAEKPWVRNFHHPVKAVALDPQFSERREKVFVSGGSAGKFVMNKKGWFSSQETELHRGEGPITTIAWRSPALIAWANSCGVKIFDNDKAQRIAYIDRPKKSGNAGEDMAEAAGCSLVWESDDTLIIGWAQTVKIVKVLRRSKRDLLADPSLLPKYAQVILWYETDFLICGIAPFGPTMLSLLTYAEFQDDASEEDQEDGSEEEDEEEATVRPQLRVIQRTSGDEVCSDALPIRSFETNKPMHYSLSAQVFSANPEESAEAPSPVLYVVSPKDVVVARTRGIEDHIAWALETGEYERALSLAEGATSESLGSYSVRNLSEKLLNHLLQDEEYEKVAALCPRLLDNDLERWVYWIDQFKQRRQLSCIAEYVPVKNPQLPSYLYEAILDEALTKGNDKLLVRIIRQWQTLLYNHSKAQLYLSGAIEDETQLEFEVKDGEAGPFIQQPLGMSLRRSATGADRRLLPRPSFSADQLFPVKSMIKKVNSAILDRPKSLPLQDALAELYCIDGQYDLALRKYLSGDTGRRNAKHIYEMIERHGLESAVQDKVLRLVSLDTPRALDLFVHSLNDVDEDGRTMDKQIGNIVQQLYTKEKVLFKFLHQLFLKRKAEYNVEANSEFHDLQIALYTKYAPDCLEEFLTASNYYSMDAALTNCGHISRSRFIKRSCSFLAAWVDRRISRRL